MKWEDQVPEQALFAMVFDEGDVQRARLPIALAHGASYRQVVTNLGGPIGSTPPIEFCELELVNSTAERAVWESLSDEHGRQAFIDILARSYEGKITDLTALTIEEMWVSTVGRDAFVDCYKGEFVDPMFLVRTPLPIKRGDEPMGYFPVSIVAGEGFANEADVMDNPVLWAGQSAYAVGNSASWVLNHPDQFGSAFDEYLAENGFLWRTGVPKVVSWEGEVWLAAWVGMPM